MRLSSRCSVLVLCLVAGASLLVSGSGFDAHLLHHVEAAAHGAPDARSGHDHSASGLEIPVRDAHSPLCILCASRQVTAASAAPAPVTTPPATQAEASPLPPQFASDTCLAGPGSPRAPPADSHPA